MSATFAYEDPLSRASQKLVGTRAQTAYVFKEMGRNMWSSGKGFAKVGAVYSGIECCIEGVSAARLGAVRCRRCLFLSLMSAASPRTFSKRRSIPILRLLVGMIRRDLFPSVHRMDASASPRPDRAIHLIVSSLFRPLGLRDSS
jgi:hypothetical protein